MLYLMQCSSFACGIHVHRSAHLLQWRRLEHKENLRSKHVSSCPSTSKRRDLFAQWRDDVRSWRCLRVVGVMNSCQVIVTLFAGICIADVWYALHLDLNKSSSYRTLTLTALSEEILFVTSVCRTNGINFETTRINQIQLGTRLFAEEAEK